MSTEMELPNAVFKPRPCAHQGGGEVLREKLELVDLGEGDGPARLEFRSEVDLGARLSPRPDEEGFRFLVEDANGATVVDLDIPGEDAREGRSKARWEVDKGGKRFEFRSRRPIGGMIPRVRVERSKKDEGLWEVRVRGRKAVFDGDDLALPLSVSVSLSPTNPPGEACFGVDHSAGTAGNGCWRGEGDESVTCRSRGAR